MRVRVCRNLKKYPLPGAMTKEDRVNLSKHMSKVFGVLIPDEAFGGKYLPVNPFVKTLGFNNSVERDIKFKNMFYDQFLVRNGISGDWPYGRYCYVSGDTQLVVCVNEEDHLRISCTMKGNSLNEVFERIEKAVKIIEQNTEGGFAVSPDFGYITSCPTQIGHGIKASIQIRLPNITAKGPNETAT